MLLRRVSEVLFGELQKRYGKTVSYVWFVEGKKLKFNTTRHVMSQRKFKEKFLEVHGEALISVSAEAWTMILNKAFSENTVAIETLEEIWLKQVALYCNENISENQLDIAEGGVYATNTGLLFTSAGLAKHFKNAEELPHFTPEWHNEKLLELLCAKSASVTLKDFKGRALKINNFSCRVDERFYNYYKAYKNHAEAA